MLVNLFISNFKNKKLLYLLSRVLIIIFVILVIDFFTGIILKNIITRVPDGRYFKLNYSLNKNESDIFIVGSSRGETHFIPKLMQDSLKVSVWNASRGNQGLPYIYSVIISSIERYKPKLIIMTVEKHFFSSELNFESASILEPFFDNKTINNLYKDKLFTKSILLNSNLIKYNSSYFYLLRPLIAKDKDGRSEDLGFNPLYGSFVGKKEDKINEYYSYDLNKESVQLFDQIISEVNAKNINLLLVISPRYNIRFKESSGFDYIKKVCNSYDNVRLLDYSMDKDFIYQDEYFKDVRHLNFKGATLLTNKTIAYIKKSYSMN